MENLNICTWNIKNSYFKLSDNKAKVAGVEVLLKDKQVDVLALQEVNRELYDAIKKDLSTFENGKYKIYPKVNKTQLTLNNVISEYNPIITKEKVDSSSNFKLPSLPNEISFDIHLRRLNEVALANGTFVLSAHLEHKVDELNDRQLKRISDRLMYLKAHYENPDIIIMGNLNKFPTHTNIMSWKRKDLNDFGLRIIELNKATYQGHEGNQPVDYIIVPKSYKVDEVKVIEELKEVSSHLPVLAKVKVK